MPHPLVVNVREHGRHACDVYVGRPSFWGNPFRVGVHGNRDRVIEMYREYLDKHPEIVERAKTELKGKVLGCYCAPLPCHADLLAEIANP